MLLSVNIILTLWVSWAHGGGRSCGFPRIKHGNIYPEDGRKPVFPVPTGKYFYYTCKNKFLTPSQTRVTRLVCTQNGWEPTPKCLRECFLPSVKNGHSTSSGKMHQEKEAVQITCNEGYSLPINQSHIKCTERGWSTPPVCKKISSAICVVKEETLKKYNIYFKWSRKKILYSTSGDHVEFVCRPGYDNVSPLSAFRVQCVDGEIEYPTCA